MPSLPRVQGQRQRLGERIRERRTALGLTQGALAAKLPGTVDINYVSRWERGVHRPSEAMLPHLAAALEVELAYLEEALVFDAPTAGAPLTQLDRIERALADARADREEHAEEIQALLQQQSDLLEGIRGLLESNQQLVASLGVPDGLTLQDHLAQLVRDTACSLGSAAAPKRRS